MTDESEDGPTFIRQRRNVMVSCLVVITIVVLNLHYGDIKILDVKAGTPQNFDIAWAALILYFMWRLYQCDAPGRVLAWPQGYAHQYVQSTLLARPDGEKYKQAAIDSYYKELKDKGLQAIRVIPTPTTVQRRTDEQMKVKEARFDGMTNLMVQRRQPIIYTLRYMLVLNHENASVQWEHKLTIEKHERLYKWAWTRAYFLSSLRTQYFSEFCLPFVLALVCILYCCYHHVVP